MPGAFSSKRNVLFDLDGTLIDSSPAHARAFVETLSACYPALARDFEYAKYAGLPTRAVFRALGLADDPVLLALVQRKQRLYREALDRGEVNIFDGAVALLERFVENGRKLFLVTGASRLSAQHILEAKKISGHFTGIVAAEDTQRGKPWPDPYLFALKTHDLDRAESIAIEDGENGVEAARTAGLEVVTVHAAEGFSGVPHAGNFAELAGHFFA